MAHTNDQQITVIGPDAHFKGEMTFAGSARILGTFEGSITTTGEIEVGQGATCNATLHATRVVVDGAVEGDVTGDDLIELNAGANVKGDLTAGNLVVVEGATFEGHCRVGNIQAQAKATPARQAQPAERPRIETRSIRPASNAGESAGAPNGASAAVARATSGAAGNTDWLKGDSDEQSAA